MEERDKLFIQIIHMLHSQHIETVAENADVSIGTLYKWMHGETLNPHSDTLFKVAKALGFHITWKIPRSLKQVA